MLKRGRPGARVLERDLCVQRKLMELWAAEGGGPVMGKREIDLCKNYEGSRETWLTGIRNEGSERQGQEEGEREREARQGERSNKINSKL